MDTDSKLWIELSTALDELQTFSVDLEDYFDPGPGDPTQDEMIRWYPSQQEMLRAAHGKIVQVVQRLRAADPTLARPW